ncbi:MAG TPA: DNA-processing protein DprA [Candidatus Butyricicoccus avistercoris]|uniref:DNA-processing protein DprA n=1 Tax=Candidatus Butyricicoccus avistercoris TaxID=2838518 RepID=A0A9D1TH44_9FIRM|nr:DNA-processing protein DprA [Candidatus Butyricicoccus avistercoris]
MSKLSYWLWLAAKDELTALVKNQLLECFGSPEHLFAMSRQEFIEKTRLNKKQIDALSDKSLQRADAIQFDCEKLGISILTMEDSAYPEILCSIPDPPIILYAKGKIPDLERKPAVGIVGTRKATPYGMTMAGEFGKQLASAGMTIVSGMALGIDGAAMRGAISAGGKTIAVLAGGINICYPPEHNFLMGDIQLTGAVISENPPSTPHKGFLFPIRNRIISGLSRAVLVVEAPARSGALITAHEALEQGREVFAIPANIDAPNSMGCNHLIRDGEAAIACEPNDILREVGLSPIYGSKKPIKQPEQVHYDDKQTVEEMWNKILKHEEKTEENKSEKQETTQKHAHIPQLQNENQKAIVDIILNGAETPEDILEQIDLPVARVMTELTMMELDGILKRENGIITINF